MSDGCQSAAKSKVIEEEQEVHPLTTLSVGELEEVSGMLKGHKTIDSTWKISHSQETKCLGQPVSYGLFPEDRPTLTAAPEPVRVPSVAFAIGKPVGDHIPSQ